mgnify:CR=1 FL=1
MATVPDASGNNRVVDQSLDDDFFAITPSDTVVLPVVTDGIHVAVSGDVTFYNRHNVLKKLTGAVAGWHPIRTNRIMATGTTATGISGMVNAGQRS